MADYLNVIYDTKSHPQTTYPAKLVSYLFHSFKMKKGQNIVINLSGRGDKDLNTVARIEGIEI